MRERMPDVRLEQHDRRKDNVAEHIGHKPIERLERSKLGRVVEHNQQATAEKNLGGVRTTNQLQELIDQ